MKTIEIKRLFWNPSGPAVFRKKKKAPENGLKMSLGHGSEERIHDMIIIETGMEVVVSRHISVLRVCILGV